MVAMQEVIPPKDIDVNSISGYNIFYKRRGDRQPRTALATRMGGGRIGIDMVKTF